MYVADTHLYTWLKRVKVKQSSLSKETTQWARLEPQTSRSGVQGVNRLATHASTMKLLMWPIVQKMLCPAFLLLPLVFMLCKLSYIIMKLA